MVMVAGHGIFNIGREEDRRLIHYMTVYAGIKPVLEGKFPWNSTF